jgi:RND family efflux transporter MFP subunit
MTILCTLGLVSGCGVNESKHSGKDSLPIPSEKTVVVANVISQNLNREIKLPADLIAFRDIEIYPKISGFIDWIGVDRGSVVKKGQLLIKMTAPELPAQSKQGVDAATATQDECTQAADELEVVKQQIAAAHAKAKASADTYQRLKGASEYPGIVSGNDLEVAQKTAEAEAAIAQSLERKCSALQSQKKAAANRHQAALQSALSSKVLESYLRLTAPFDGVITERNVHEGSFVNPPAGAASQPLLRLKQLSLLRLVVPVPEADLGRITPGAKLRFSVSAYPGEFFTGIVRRVADSVDLNTRTMPVELDVTNSDRRLAPGMFAEVLWTVRRIQPSNFVPQTSVVKTTEKTFVIRIKDGVAAWIDVKPGLSGDDLIEVFGDLQAGDQVVVKGTDELRAGTRVKLQDSSITEAYK